MRREGSFKWENLCASTSLLNLYAGNGHWENEELTLKELFWVRVGIL